MRQRMQRRHRMRAPGLALLALTLAACGANEAPAVVTQVPTATLTVTASVTPTPVLSPTPTRTLAPAPPTHPPTTATPGPSPTHPLAPTITDAPATLTATFAPTRAGVRIEYFMTDAGAVAPGQTVTLYWRVRGATRARIYRLDETGERQWRWDVNPEGSLTVTTRREDGDAARFLLEADAGGAAVEQPLLVPLECGEVWFFEPPPAECPAGPPQYSRQAEQTFERGRMIWVAAEDRIYAIFDDGQSPGWTSYRDDFEEGMPDRDASLAAPDGLQQPIRGFGLVWRTQSGVRDRLGWAVSAETGYEGALQSTAAEPDGGTLYLRTRDGGILALEAQRSRWRFVP